MIVLKCVDVVPFNSFTIGKFYTATVCSDGADFVRDDDGDKCGITSEYLSKCFEVSK